MTLHFRVDAAEGGASGRGVRLLSFVAAAICAVQLSSPLLGQSNTFPSTGDVGIGTTTPVSPLQVVGTSTLTNATFGPGPGSGGQGTFDALGLTEADGQGFADLSSNLYYNGSQWNLRNTSNDGWVTAMNNNPMGTSPQSGWGVYHAAYNASPATLTGFFNITPSGNIGVGTTKPNSLLNIFSSTSYGSGGTLLTLEPAGMPTGPASMLSWQRNTDNWTPAGIGQLYSSGEAYGGNLMLYTHADDGSNTSAPLERLRILANGNVGIGTTDPANLLSVHGTIQAEEVLVNTGWSDYVFDPDYRLQPLSEVADYVKENHHLPEIPSAAEVKENGVSLGEMQSKLLAKIEELTLHMIQTEERNDRLEQQNQDLQARIARLESHDTKTDVASDRSRR
jgi:hypothetical protein